MIAYKFLGAGRVGPFSGFVWPEPGGWVRAEGELAVCAQGVHACRVSDLPFWIAEELWRVELEGSVVEHELKLVAQAGALSERVDAWQGPTRQRFADFCLLRAAHHAAVELRGAGLETDAEAVGQAASDADAQALGAAAGSAASNAAQGGRLARHAGHLASYVLDALAWREDAAGVAYVAAHAADSRSDPDDDGDPFVREREIQARWLAEALQLVAG
jgi:hypothetical protein